MKKFTSFLLYVLFSLSVFGQTLTQNIDNYLGENDDIHSSSKSTEVFIAKEELNPSKNASKNDIAILYQDDQVSINSSQTNTASFQSINEFTLAVMGSSVPRGQGADPGKGYAQLFAKWLAEKAKNKWTTTNISVSGNNTIDVLNRWDRDLFPVNSRYVFYGLSLGNEGIHEKGQAAFDSYRDNMQILINRTKEAGKIPLIGNNYPRADFSLTDYNYLKQMNMLIHQWDVPSVNLLGAIDNGSGRWATSCQADNAHPNTAGHAEMYYAFVPSLMDALAEGKPQPVKDSTTYFTFDKKQITKRITWVPENIVHSFTFTFTFKTTSSGILASLQNKNRSTSQLRIGANGKLYYETQLISKKLISENTLNDSRWHTVTLTHYYARERTFLYVDGKQITNAEILEKLVPVRFYLNDFQKTLSSVDFRELYFHRSGMSSDEITALHAGNMLKSSLEIYAPLNGTAATVQESVRNLAQSLNELFVEVPNRNSNDKFLSQNILDN